MARCTRTWSLDVHHKRRDEGNGLDNAEVLCSKYHEATSTYGNPGPTPPPFSGVLLCACLSNYKLRREEFGVMRHIVGLSVSRIVKDDMTVRR